MHSLLSNLRSLLETDDGIQSIKVRIPNKVVLNNYKELKNKTLLPRWAINFILKHLKDGYQIWIEWIINDEHGLYNPAEDKIRLILVNVQNNTHHIDKIAEGDLDHKIIEPFIKSYGLHSERDAYISTDDLPKLKEDKDTPPEVLVGGKGDGKTLADFDPEEVAMGIKVEMEHTNDEKIAAEIVCDHLSENPKYYSILKASGLADELVDEAVGKATEIKDFNKFIYNWFGAKSASSSISHKIIADSQFQGFSKVLAPIDIASSDQRVLKELFSSYERTHYINDPSLRVKGNKPIKLIMPRLDFEFDSSEGLWVYKGKSSIDVVRYNLETVFDEGTVDFDLFETDGLIYCKVVNKYSVPDITFEFRIERGDISINDKKYPVILIYDQRSHMSNLSTRDLSYIWFWMKEADFNEIMNNFPNTMKARSKASAGSTIILPLVQNNTALGAKDITTVSSGVKFVIDLGTHDATDAVKKEFFTNDKGNFEDGSDKANLKATKLTVALRCTISNAMLATVEAWTWDQNQDRRYNMLWIQKVNINGHDRYNYGKTSRKCKTYDECIAFILDMKDQVMNKLNAKDEGLDEGITKIKLRDTSGLKTGHLDYEYTIEADITNYWDDSVNDKDQEHWQDELDDVYDAVFHKFEDVLWQDIKSIPGLANVSFDHSLMGKYYDIKDSSTIKDIKEHLKNVKFEVRINVEYELSAETRVMIDHRIESTIKKHVQ